MPPRPDRLVMRVLAHLAFTVRGPATIGLALLCAAPVAAQDALEVPGFGAASVVAPSTTEPRPVVIALHGNFDRPEWMCSALAPVVRGRAWIVCPRGIPRDDAPEGDPRFEHRPPRGVVREVAAARDALAAAHPGRVLDGPDVWVGFSQGAHRVAAIAARDASVVRLMLLIEGGTALFGADAAERYARSAPRVAITCALPGCAGHGRRLAEAVDAGRGAGRVERISTCHACLDVMQPAIERSFDFLVAGDPRFGAAITLPE